MSSRPETELPLLVLQHVPWEGPHRILRAFDGIPVQLRHPLSTPAPLPEPTALRGAVLMGGPMSVNDTAEHPRLAEELAWISRALAVDLPLLGVCLGSQLIARALGATVAPGPEPEIGVAPISVHEPADPLVGALAPATPVLHWHGEQFTLPAGATALASSAITPVQAFRAGSAWGLLFHAEADAELVDLWLDEPAMRAEAEQTLGPAASSELRAQAVQLQPARGDALFAAFAAQCAAFAAER